MLGGRASVSTMARRITRLDSATGLKRGLTPPTNPLTMSLGKILGQTRSRFRTRQKQKSGKSVCAIQVGPFALPRLINATVRGCAIASRLAHAAFVSEAMPMQWLLLKNLSQSSRSANRSCSMTRRSVSGAGSLCRALLNDSTRWANRLLYTIAMAVTITKEDGQQESFDPSKLHFTLGKAGASKSVQDEIIAHIEKELKEGMTTHEI